VNQEQTINNTLHWVPYYTYKLTVILAVVTPNKTTSI